MVDRGFNTDLGANFLAKRRCSFPHGPVLNATYAGRKLFGRDRIAIQTRRGDPEFFELD